MSYDSGGQLRSIKSSATDQLKYSWNQGLPNSITWEGSVNGSVGYTWLPHGRLGSISVNTLPVATYTYTPEGEISNVNELQISRSSATGLRTGTAIHGVITKESFNNFGETIGHEALVNASSLVSFNYTKDALGRIKKRIKTEGASVQTTIFNYDSIGQLLNETTDGLRTNYSYDANGNRLTSGGTEIYDEHDRLVSNSEWTYTYSRSGYLRNKTHKSNGSMVDYAYDNLGNLLQVKTTGGATVEYAIDAADRRLSRKVNGGFEDGFLYQNELRPVAQLNQDGNVRSLFIYGSLFNSPDLIVKDGVTYRVLHDQLGSPIYVINTQNNALVQKMSYDSWGKVITDTNPGFQPFGFAGGLYDPITGLVRFGARDYDPTIGRWLNKDPIRFDGGWNLYGYVGNDPVNFLDLDGKRPTSSNKVLSDLYKSLYNESRSRTQTKDLLDQIDRLANAKMEILEDNDFDGKLPKGIRADGLCESQRNQSSGQKIFFRKSIFKNSSIKALQGLMLHELMHSLQHINQEFTGTNADEIEAIRIQKEFMKGF